MDFEAELAQSFQYFPNLSRRLAHFHLAYKGVGKATNFVLAQILKLAGSAKHSSQLLGILYWD